jgi:serine/threonine protein kinase
VCSLQQLLDQHDFVLSADQAVHVFTSILEFILLIKKQGYCHSDIKPENTQLVRCEGADNAY